MGARGVWARNMLLASHDDSEVRRGWDETCGAAKTLT